MSQYKPGLSHSERAALSTHPRLTHRLACACAPPGYVPEGRYLSGGLLAQVWHRLCLYNDYIPTFTRINVAGTTAWEEAKPMVEIGYSLSSEEFSPHDLVRYAQRAEEVEVD